MSLEHRFVFGENVLLRCKYVENEYVPIEMMDFDDIICRLKKLVFQAKELHRSSEEEVRSRSSSLIERLDQLFENRRNSAPLTSNQVTSSPKTRQGSIEDIKKESVMLQMSPAMRNNRKFKSKTKNSTGRLSPFNSATHLIPPLPSSPLVDLVKTKEEKKNKKNEIKACLDESSPDFVHVISFVDTNTAEEFLQDLHDLHITVGIEIDVSNEGAISIIYQKLSDFKFDFMMVDLSRKTDFMLFLKPF